MSFISMIGPDLEIISDAGERYTLSAFSFTEMAEYVLWYQFLDVENVIATTKDYPKEVRDRLIYEAHERCRNKSYKYLDAVTGEEKEAAISWENAEVQESCMTVEGIAQQLYLSLKINHPNLKKADVSKIVTLASYKEVLDKILIINGLIEPGSEEEVEGELQPNQ